MGWITARRRHPAAGYAVVLLGLLVMAMAYAAFTGSSGAASAAAPADGPQAAINAGKQLFTQDCATCHGMEAQGTVNGPSLIGVGAAAVDFQVSTGRMPAKEPGPQMPRKPAQLNPAQTHQLAAYIASLAGGPPIPTPEQVSTSGTNIGLGQSLFNADCAQCHNFDGAGGALTEGKYAPPLTASTPTQIYEAMLTGPESMPVFNDTTITPNEKRDIVAFVTETRAQPNPGGFSLGRVGPVTEGLVAFLGLLFAMVAVALWITAKHGKAHE